VRLSEDKYCTVGQTLANGTEMTHTIELVEG
ncbi:peroxiredoxin, partial [bacterium]|nr:peroxiredoxin [bacterium]